MCIDPCMDMVQLKVHSSFASGGLVQFQNSIEDASVLGYHMCTLAEGKILCPRCVHHEQNYCEDRSIGESRKLCMFYDKT